MVVTSHDGRRRTAGLLPGATVLTAAAALALTIAMASPALARPSHPLSAHPAGRAATPHLTAPRSLSPGQAAARAKQAGHPVGIPGLTTPTSATRANPDGTFTVTESLHPVRAWRHGAWARLNPALHANPGGTISPAVTTNGLTLSSGGTTTLAVMTAGPRSLTLSWPGTLPTPTLSGPTATYANVFPGVDLVITADDQGGFSDTLVVHSAAAADNPALDSLSLDVASTGLVLSADAAGDLSAAAGPAAPALITAQAPRIWDSTPPPPGMATVTAPDGTILDAATGLPAYSSVTSPGAAAQTAAVPVSLSAGTITLAPPASVLTGPGVTYPVYIDPTFHNFASASASAWTQVDAGFPNQSYWHESSDLQSGDCPSSLGYGCNGMGVARSFLRMPIPSQLTATTDVGSAELYMTEVWAPSCIKKSVRLYSVGSISASTTWNHQPGWASNYAYQDAAFGYSGCGYYTKDITWDVTGTIASDAGHLTNQTWGLRAADESDQYAWKQFWSGSSNLTLSVAYNYPPNTPASPSTSPGGSCHTSSASPAQIGDDDVTFSAYVSDNDGDNDLSTRLVIYNSGGTVAYDTASKGTTVVTGDKTSAGLPLPRTTIQGFHTDGSTKPYTYYWQAQTTDDFSLSGGWSAKCWFTYNPEGPQAPTITGPASPVILGSQAAFTFTTPGCGTGSPCPLSYTYQLDANPPVTVTADANGNWSGTITITREGAPPLAVYGSSAGGNPSEPAYFTSLTVNPPSPAYPDGYFSGGASPDLLTIGTGNQPSLWLSTGSGNGTLNSPVDIGSLGTTVNSGADGPGDWTGALALHGSFTGDSVQDVIAYYPATGNGFIIGGAGDQSPLVPSTSWTIPWYQLSDTNFCDPGSGSSCTDDPIDLVAAGNASQLGTGTDDLIGIAGDPTNGYELDLYTSGGCGGCGNPGSYAFYQALSGVGQAPNNTNWHNYTLATAQPGCYPHQQYPSDCHPANVVLLALNNNTGKLWKSTGSPTASIGTNWTQITVPWGSSPPSLLSSDVNAQGNIELWTCSGGSAQPSSCSGGTITAYTLSGSTLSPEHTQTYNAPLGEWPLNDGYNQPGTTTAIDTITGNAASLNGSTIWNPEDYFSEDILDNQSGYIAPPPNTIPSTNHIPKISVWFKTTTPDQVLASVQANPLSSGTTTTSGYNPVLYIGTDGHLYAEWWNGQIDPAVSSTPVDDGLWHHAILTGYANGLGTYQTLYLDNQPGITLQGAITGNMANFTIGGGYIGGGWPSESHYQQNGGTGYREYFNGEIAETIYSYPGGP